MLNPAVCKVPGRLKRLTWIALKRFSFFCALNKIHFAYKSQAVVFVQENNLFVLKNAAVGFKTSDYFRHNKKSNFPNKFNPLNPKLNPICYLLALLGAHHFFYVSRIRVKL